MDILKKTPRTQMAWDSFVTKMSGIYESVAADLGYEKSAVDLEMGRFAQLSCRVRARKGEFDFELAEVTDTPEQIRAKFLKYVDTSRYEAALDALRKADELDRPVSPPEQAPEPPAEKN